MYQKVSGIEKFFLHKRGTSQFSVAFFFLIVPEDFVDEPICVSDSFWYGKLPKNRGEGHLSLFSVEIVLSQRSEKYS